ncbi:MAG: winged helix-turn-helix domain-containing protein [archaeon]|nr:LysR family transcriptional regulator [Candidatus Bathyarchaeum sp.]
MQKLFYETKVWMVNEKREAVFGGGLQKLLEEIDKCKSISGAAENLDMSYRYALHRITISEKRLGQSLVTRRRGGTGGGGSSELTDAGKDLLTRYVNAKAEIAKMLKSLE